MIHGVLVELLECHSNGVALLFLFGDPTVVVASWTWIALSCFRLIGNVFRVVHIGFMIGVEGGNGNTLYLACIDVHLLAETDEPSGFKDNSPGKMVLCVSYKNLEQLYVAGEGLHILLAFRKCSGRLDCGNFIGF